MGINYTKLAKMKYAAAVHQMIDEGRFPITLEQYCLSNWSVPNLCLGEWKIILGGAELFDVLFKDKSFEFSYEKNKNLLICATTYGLLVLEMSKSSKEKRESWLRQCAPFRPKTRRKKMDDFLESYEWRKVRMEAIKKYGAKCQCCGASAKDGVVINVDHIKPRKTNPELALCLDNLQVLCDACNHGKGNWDRTDWRSK